MRTQTIHRGRDCQGIKWFLERLAATQRIFRATFIRRTDLVVEGELLERKGSIRNLTCKGKPNKLATKNWRPKNGTLPFAPDDHDLFLVYSVEGKKGNDGRGNHWAFIDLRTVREIQFGNQTYKVI